MKRRNFKRRTQQPDETFNNFWVFLRELVKTCNFYSDVCTQKSIRDQGLLDGDTVETLLQDTDLTLAKTISKCQAQEAAKKQRASPASQQPEIIAALQKPSLPYRNHERKEPWHPNNTIYSLDVELQITQLAILSALHITKHASGAKKLAILLRCAIAKVPDATPTPWQHRL